MQPAILFLPSKLIGFSHIHQRQLYSVAIEAFSCIKFKSYSRRRTLSFYLQSCHSLYKVNYFVLPICLLSTYPFFICPLPFSFLSALISPTDLPLSLQPSAWSSLMSLACPISPACLICPYLSCPLYL